MKSGNSVKSVSPNNQPIKPVRIRPPLKNFKSIKPTRPTTHSAAKTTGGSPLVNMFEEKKL